MAELTPMMRQYLEIKEKNKDCILFFRLGDFYEMFGEDAKTASQELDIVLTTRDRNKENPEERTPMCGVPYHSSESYIARLIAKGYKVAICEQMEDPALAKGLVERDIVRIITPGTLIESSMLDEGKSNYLCAVSVDETGAAAAFAELSTGEMAVTEFADADMGHIMNEIGAYLPAEAVLDGKAWESAELRTFLKERMECMTQKMDVLFDFEKCRELLRVQFKTQMAEDLKISRSAVMAVGSLLQYMTDTQKTDLSHINTLRINTGEEYMELDLQTLRSLELVASIRAQEKKGSLLWVLDKTKTAMGRRLMRSWVLRPLLSPVHIGRRQAAVKELYDDTVCRGELIEALRQIGDIERLIGKIVYGTANGRDMRALWASLCYVPQVAGLIYGKNSVKLKELASMDILEDVRELIDSTDRKSTRLNSSHTS